MRRRAFIVHGFVGVPDDAWKPWLRRKLEGAGFEVTAPAMPDPADPQMDLWVETLARAVGEPEESCFFVGHSLGCITILRYLESLKAGSVGGVVLIAGFATEIDARFRSFFVRPVDWEQVRARCTRFAVIASDNDPHVPLRAARDLAGLLSAPLSVAHHHGHFGVEDDITEIPPALALVLQMAGVSG